MRRIWLAMMVLALVGCGPRVSTAASSRSSATANSCPEAAYGKPCRTAASPIASATPGSIAYIQPSSASFIDAQEGWVVGHACDAQGNCRPGLAHTNDGGASWIELPAPPQQQMPAGEDPWPGTAVIRFTTSTDGWLFNPFLAKTLDGGRTWQMVNLPTSDPVTNVFAFSGSIWVLTSCDAATPCMARLWESSSTTGSFQLASSQPPNSGNLNGAYSEAITAGSRVILFSPFAAPPSFALTADGKIWAQIASPCPGPHQQLGSSPGGVLLAVCWAAVGGGWAPKEAWISSDEGAHWSLRSRSADFGNSSSLVGTITEHGYPNDIAMPTSLDAWMSMGRDDLYETHDGGITWIASAVPGQFGGDAGGAGQVIFVDGQHGWALSTGGLYRTTDGRHWSRADIIGPIPGYPG